MLITFDTAKLLNNFWMGILQCWFTFKNYAKLWYKNPWRFLCTDELHGLDRLLHQESWIRKYGCSDLYVLFCLIAQISQHRQKLSPRGFVFPDRLNPSYWWPWPKSLRSACLSVRFWTWVSSSVRHLCRGEPHDPVLRSYIKFNEATEWQRVLLTIHKRLSDLN